MKYIIIFAVLFCSCTAKTAKKDNLQIKNTPELSKSEVSNYKIENEEYNPPFYLRIFGVYTGSTFYDENLKCDMVYRIILYNVEEQITTVVEKIIIGNESGPTKLLKQEKLLEKNLNLPDDSIYKVEFIDWLNPKEIKLKINDKNFIIDLEKLTYK